MGAEFQDPASCRREDLNPSSCVRTPPISMSKEELQAEGAGAIDLESWRGDLHRLHINMDSVVQGFIAKQTCQLDAVANELASQMDRIAAKEKCFDKLSSSIADFVETEAARTEVWGLSLAEPGADAMHEAYDADLPGPPALHRISRNWRKMTKAFEVMKAAKENEASKVLGDEKDRMEAHFANERARMDDLLTTADERCETARREHAAEVEALKLVLEISRIDNGQKDSKLETITNDLRTVSEQCEAAESQLATLAQSTEQSGAARGREEYEREAEREELIREHADAQACVADLQATIEASKSHEAELLSKYAERGEKLEQMKRIMDDQEREMTVKIDRVQQYVKERQAGALVAEKKQIDAERMADRWQHEVQRLQAEKDRLGAIVLDLESHKSSHTKDLQGTTESHQNEVTRLQEALLRKEEEMQSANTELLNKRDEEYQSKMTHERQREKDRSIALLNKKQQELQIKEQQLKAARQRIQELESGSPNSGDPTSAARASPSSRGRKPGADACSPLPPLPLSAR